MHACGKRETHANRKGMIDDENDINWLRAKLGGLRPRCKDRFLLGEGEMGCFASLSQQKALYLEWKVVAGVEINVSKTDQ